MAAVLLTVCLGAGCSDDNIPSVSPGSGGRISFEVCEIGDNDGFTRSGAKGTAHDYAPGTFPRYVELTGNDRPTYLVPIVTDNVQTAVTTRSTLVDSNTISDFGVFASRSDASVPDNSYMDNVEITRASGWTPEKEYLWPGDGSLHFTAYSPYTSSSSEEGITALPDAAAPSSLSFKVASEVSAQEDLLVAVPTDASASPCKISFNHALTAIKFAAGSELVPCTVKEISISGVADSGVLSLEAGTWSETSGNASYTVTPDVSL